MYVSWQTLKLQWNAYIKDLRFEDKDKDLKSEDKEKNKDL